MANRRDDSHRRAAWLRATHWLFLPLLLPSCLLLNGCAANHAQLRQAILAEGDRTAVDKALAQAYQAACPDVLDLRVASCPELSVPQPIAPDGCITLGNLGRLRVEGQTHAAIAEEVAAAAGVAQDLVDVRVAEYRSQQLYVVGQVAGLQRAVPYRGPETVVELLQRIGGVTPGAALDDVYVVRSRVADGRQPEVFRVDLYEIVFGHDERTNVRLQPFDQIFVGETRQCCLEKCVPPWLRPMYESMCGMCRKK